ncbi:hypothetical protein OGATHE_001450 [Ogataea polymorpha]|uniref:Uncharacterized protein n=1 Tax=Ogataea polymorpha TaxID=460523 RepID=A0A9P8PSQ5_9ASCO|nr:hypothetical protein OGATHE_001450 [Ogataea polymorpha]
MWHPWTVCDSLDSSLMRKTGFQDWFVQISDVPDGTAIVISSNRHLALVRTYVDTTDLLFIAFERAPDSESILR